MKRGEKNSKKNIYLLGSSSFFNDVSSEMITPILPFYILALGGGGFAVGSLSGLREGLSSLAKILGGWLSDRNGKRKPFVFLGYIISLIARFFLLLTTSWQFILGAVSFERVGKLRDAPRDAIIASYKGHERGKLFGMHQVMDTCGAVVGTLLVIFFFWKFGLNFRLIILVASLIAIFSIFPLLFVKELKYKKTKENLSKGIKHLNKKLKYFVFTAGVFALANFGINMFLLLKAKEITGSTIAALGMYAMFNIIYASLILHFGKLSDSIGRKRVLLIGYILFFFLVLGASFFNGLFAIMAFFAIYGIIYAITQSNQRAFASDLSGNLKGTAMGFYHSVVGLVSIPAGIIAGLLWDFSHKFMFIYLSIVSLTAIILLFHLKEDNSYKK